MIRFSWTFSKICAFSVIFSHFQTFYGAERTEIPLISCLFISNYNFVRLFGLWFRARLVSAAFSHKQNFFSRNFSRRKSKKSLSGYPVKKVFRNSFKSISIKKFFFENFDFCEIRSDINVGVGKSLLQSVQKCFFSR